MKKIVSLVIVLTMLLCMVPVSTMTATATTFQSVDLSGYSNGAEYEAEDGTVYKVVKQASSIKNAQYSSKDTNYILAQDINLNGHEFTAAIFGEGSAYGGKFNGNGYATTLR